jgi:hypothetical protein
MDGVLDEFFLMNSGLMRKNWLQPLRTFICSHQEPEINALTTMSESAMSRRLESWKTRVLGNLILNPDIFEGGCELPYQA